MITFVTLFLWLVTGVQTVELAVDAGVHRVELVVDGEIVSQIEKAPWKTTIDFGPLLEPHELVAIAYDEDGGEIERAVQVVNLPRPEVEARIVLDRDAEGRAKSFRVFAQSSEKARPASIMAVFDGEVLEADKDGRFTIPDHDPEMIHLISAEASYPNGSVATTDLSLGGFGQIVASELTAIPIQASGDPPTAESLEGLLTIDGEKLRVVAVESSGARIYVVRDLGATQSLRSAGNSFTRPFKAVRVKHDPIIEFDLEPEIDRAYLVGVNANAARGISLFPVAGAVSLKRWSLPWAITSLFDREGTVDGQRLADAIAVAGIRAAGHGSPRAVLVVLSKKPGDASTYEVDAVRHYLDELRVPLHVWVTGKQTSTIWGPAIKTSSASDLTKASKKLLKDLDDQWIVWVDGRHLAKRVEFDGEGLGLELVGD